MVTCQPSEPVGDSSNCPLNFALKESFLLPKHHKQEGCPWGCPEPTGPEEWAGSPGVPVGTTLGLQPGCGSPRHQGNMPCACLELQATARPGVSRPRRAMTSCSAPACVHSVRHTSATAEALAEGCQAHLPKGTRHPGGDTSSAVLPPGGKGLAQASGEGQAPWGDREGPWSAQISRAGSGC